MFSSGNQAVAAPTSSELMGADLDPQGWISHEAPNGRTFWHHRALGPAPWELGPLPGCQTAQPRKAETPFESPKAFSERAPQSTPIQLWARSAALSEADKLNFTVPVF